MDYYKLRNRSSGVVVYTTSLGRRDIMPGEAIRVTYDELEKLCFKPGGRALMANFLQLEDDDVLKNLNIHTEPEYFMTEQQIVDLLKEGTLEAFLDCLDFAPQGVIDLVKQYAVTLPLENTEKRRALKEKLGFEVDKAIQNSSNDEEVSVESQTKPADAVTGRRSNVTYKI